MDSVFWLNKALVMSILLGISYCTGHLVLNKGVKVNYTRKINHFALFFIPMFITKVLVIERSPENYYIGAAIAILSLFLYLKPIRSRVPVVNQMFASFDRPEDRPNTMLWLISQTMAGYLVLTFFLGFFISHQCVELIFLPVIINGIGDGLAEPVGVKFGKHKYKVRALFSKVKYERSFEGSACVFITSVVTVFLFKGYFTPPEFLFILITMPVFMTLAEAFSPHTWDTPFLFLTGFTLLTIVKMGVLF